MIRGNLIIDRTLQPLTTTQIAAIMGLSEITIRRQARDGWIPGAFKPSARTRKRGAGRVEWRFKRVVFMQWWEQQQQPGVTIYRSMRQRRPRTSQKN